MKASIEHDGESIEIERTAETICVCICDKLHWRKAWVWHEDDALDWQFVKVDGFWWQVNDCMDTCVEVN